MLHPVAQMMPNSNDPNGGLVPGTIALKVCVLASYDIDDVAQRRRPAVEREYVVTAGGEEVEVPTQINLEIDVRPILASGSRSRTSALRSTDIGHIERVLCCGGKRCRCERQRHAALRKVVWSFIDDLVGCRSDLRVARVSSQCARMIPASSGAVPASPGETRPPGTETGARRKTLRPFVTIRATARRLPRIRGVAAAALAQECRPACEGAQIMATRQTRPPQRCCQRRINARPGPHPCCHPCRRTLQRPCRRRCRATRCPSWRCACPSRAAGSPGCGSPTRRSGGRSRSRRR